MEKDTCLSALMLLRVGFGERGASRGSGVGDGTAPRAEQRSAHVSEERRRGLGREAG